MPSVEQILTRESSKKNVMEAATAALENKKQFDELIHLIRTAKTPLNWRALWAVEMCNEQNPELIIPYLEQLASEYPAYTNSGINRMLPKLFSAHINELSEDALGIIAEKCFELLMNPKNDYAVLVNCMQFLFDLTSIYPDLKPELYAVTEQLLSELSHSGAIRSRAGKILHKLEFESFSK
jgi:hypothetical protein